MEGYAQCSRIGKFKVMTISILPELIKFNTFLIKYQLLKKIRQVDSKVHMDK